MNAARVFLTVAAVGWLAGCQSVRARRLATNQDALKAGNAIVVISTSADEGCFRFSQVDVFPANGVSPEAAIPLNHSGLKSDFADHVGFFDAFSEWSRGPAKSTRTCSFASDQRPRGFA